MKLYLVVHFNKAKRQTKLNSELDIESNTIHRF